MGRTAVKPEGSTVYQTRSCAQRPQLHREGTSWVVYVQNTPVPLWTDMVTNLAPAGESDVHARAVIRIMHRLHLILQDLPGDWNAPEEKVRTALQRLFEQLGMALVIKSKKKMTVFCKKISPSTARAGITALQSGFEQLNLLGVRRKDRLMDALMLERAAVSRHTAAVRDPNRVPEFDRSPIAVSRQSTESGERTTVFLDQFDLPAHVRAAGTKAGWRARDWVVFHLMTDAGARVAEACEVTLGGWVRGNLGRSVWLRNKGQGRLPGKEAVLSEEGYLLLRSYFEHERLRHDPDAPAFVRWAQGRPYTPENYLEFLAARNIDPDTVQVLLNDRSRPLRTDSYRDCQWAGMRSHLKMNLTPHHCRHYYVNEELRRIEQEFWPASGSEQEKEQYRREVNRFIRQMGWKDPLSLLTYDHSGELSHRMDWKRWGERTDRRSAGPERIRVADGAEFTTAYDSGLTGSAQHLERVPAAS